MRNKGRSFHMPVLQAISPRREFLRKGTLLVTLAGIATPSFVAGCNEAGEDEVTPAEDLMREHGVLNRIMLIYDTCHQKLTSGEWFPVEALQKSAQLIRSFIEDYHEMLEEKFLFPRFVNSNQLVDLVQLLYIQHHAGRVITDAILQLGGSSSLNTPENMEKLALQLYTFNRMYRAHEAREDTVLFPALRKIVSRNEYYAMGEDFEKKEHDLFGEDGFEKVVGQVADIEKQLGIYDMSAITPAV